MCNIEDIYKMLNWNNSIEIQLQGISLAEKINDLSLLIQPPAEPSVWEHCANILYKKSDDVLTPYLNELLEWLQDLNWPGSVIILERLKIFSGEKLIKPFINCFINAFNTDDTDGLIWLDYLSELLDNEELKTKLPKDILLKLQKHYHNWRFWDDKS